MKELVFDKFVDYLESNKSFNLHKELNKVIDDFSPNLADLNHIILHGPSGVGKYTQALSIISKYSESNLKYEKKTIITVNKDQYYYKLSDVHIEIDMKLLGPNSKVLWINIINELHNIVNSLNRKNFIILCKNFDKIRDELLEIFYGYLSRFEEKSINFKYMIITENPSCLPEEILNICMMIPVKRPSASDHKKLREANRASASVNSASANSASANSASVNSATLRKIKSLSKSKLKSISNLKELTNFDITSETKFLDSEENIVDKLFTVINDYQSLSIKTLRNDIYDIFTYNLCMKKCIKKLIFRILNEMDLSLNKIKEIFLETNNFYKLYNNNYRPIYHIENLILTFIKIIHEL